MILAGYRFRFSLLGGILTIVGVSLFFSLGSWQVNRAGIKEALQEKIDSRQNAPAFVLQSSIDNISEYHYSPVKARGHYDSKNEILIDSEVYQGKAGYHVLTPLILKEDGAVIMVNRGWVPVGRSRQVLPDINTPTGELVIYGIISPHKSKPAIVLDNANLDATKVWAYFDAKVYAEHRGYNLLPAVILMDKNKGDGYIRSWPKYNAKVSMHIGYAIQWYAFALIAFITYIAVNVKKTTVNGTLNE